MVRSFASENQKRFRSLDISMESTIRLLILEDAPVLCDMLTDRLTGIFQDRTQNEITGRLAQFQELAFSDEFDAVIVDLNVLDANAPKVAAVLHDLPAPIQEKVIVHSSEPWSKLKGLGLCKFAIIPKAASRFELKGALKKVGAVD